MSTLSTPDAATTIIRAGFEAQCGEPAAVAVMVYEQSFATADMDPEKQSIENPNIKPSGHAAEPLPGKAIVGGTEAGAPDADGFLPFIAAALRKISAQTNLGSGAFRHTYGRSQATAVPGSITVEKDRDDSIITDLDVGVVPTEFTLSVANSAAPSFSVTYEAAYNTPWKASAERHPNPATGSIVVRGLPEQWIDRPDGDAGALSLTLVDLFTDSNSREFAVFIVRNGKVGPVTGTWTVSAGTKAFAGSGGAALTDLVGGGVGVGDVIEHEGEYLTVDVVTDDDTFTTIENHVAGTSAKKVVREYGSAAQASLFFSPTRPGISTQLSLPQWGTVFDSSGGFMGNRLAGSTVEIDLTANTGIVAGTLAALAGTVTTAVDDATVTGSGTAFDTALSIGDHVVTAGGVEKRVLTITSATVFEADSDYTAVEAGVAMSSRPRPSVALTGTISTAGSTATTGAGTAFLTELAIGSLVRTAGGEENRVLTVTDNTNLVMTKAWTGTEPAVAGTTTYEWTVPRERVTWTPSDHASGQFVELLAEVNLLMSTTSVPEEEVSIAESVEITFSAGKAALLGIGSEFAAGVFDQGQSSGTATLVMKKINTNIRKAILAQEQVRIRMVMSTGVAISTSVFEYTWEWIFHLKPAGKPALAADISNLETLTGALFDNAADADGHTDALQLIVTSDRATPAATS